MGKEKESLLKRWIQRTPREGKSYSLKAYTNPEQFLGSYASLEGGSLGSSYDKNAVVYRCVTLLARNIASVPLNLYAHQVRIHQHPVLDLLARPNPMQNYSSLCEAMVTHLLLSGNAFMQAVATEDSGDTLCELHVLRPDRVHMRQGPSGMPMAYEYAVGSRKYTLAVDPDTGASPILHVKLFNPMEDHLGMSPLKSAQSMVDLQNVIVAHNLALLRNAGCPSGALMVKGSQLTPQQHSDLRQQVQGMKSRAGAGTMLVLDGDFEWKEMGLRPKDMDFNEGRTMAAREIAQVFGVPPMCIGILGDSTYSNYQEARLHLWEDTCLPLLDMLLGHLNRWLLPYYGAGLTLSYNKDDIHALIPRREKMWEKVCKISCLTINEKRKMLGYEPLRGGDTLAEGSERTALLEENLS